MTHKKFNSLANGLMSQASKVRNAKMVEYEAEIDRLANFRKAANLSSQTVPEYFWVLDPYCSTAHSLHTD